VTTSIGTSGEGIKDFIEHLRAVHFAATALAISLIVLAAPPDERFSKALSEATQIQKLSDTWSNVRSKFVDEAARRVSQVTNEEHLISVERPHARGDTFRSVLHLTTENKPTETQSPYVFPGRRMDSPPTTVDEFAQWWNRLESEGMEVNLVDLTQLPTACEALSEYQETFSRGEHLDCRELQRDYVKAGDAVPTEMDLEIDYNSLAGPGLTVFVWQRKLVVVAPTHGTKGLMWQLYVRETRKVGRARLDLAAAQALFPDWRTHRGQFDGAFAELASMPKDLRYVPLADAVARIRDMQPHAEQQVEVIGLKIPTENLIQWGSLLLIGVQFYFWLHLGELRRRLSSNSIGTEVAWIGLYRSWFAFGAVVLTIFVLPVWSYWTLLCRAPAGFNPSSFAAAVGLGLGILLGISAARRVLYIRSRVKL